MDIKKFLPKKEEEQEYLWALIIEPGWVQAGIWRIYDDRAQVVYSGVPVAWELEEDLTNSADVALSAAIQNFPEEVSEPSKTVFGVVSSWVEGGEIKPEYLERIKKLCSELSLKPVGFVVLSEAISHFIKSQEGSPASAITIGVYKESIEISVFKLGKLLGNTKVARSISLVDDVAEGISRFSQEGDMPSRILIYNGREAELEEARQLLHNANWEDFETVRFLHTPKIETIDSRRKIEIVSLAGASELANVTSLQPSDEKRDVLKEEEEIGDASVEEISPSEAGFVLEEDVTRIEPQLSEVETERKIEGETVERFESFDNIKPVEDRTRTSPAIFKKANLGFLSSFGERLKVFLSRVKPVEKYFVLGRRSFIFGSLFLVLIFVGGFLFWWFYPKASVTVYVSPKSLSEKLIITVDPRLSSSDLSEKILTGDLLEAEVASEKTKPTSGTKTVGEKARGKVVIYRVGTPIRLSSGTLLTGPGNLKFTLDEDVEIASGSAGTPARVEARVTALDIGAQYNLAAGANFSVGDHPLSSLEAKNEESFSGGSSREISAVSKEDQESLSEELYEEILARAKDDLLKKVPEGKIFIEESLTATPSSKIFSNKVGDEAESLKLQMSLKVTALSIDKEELLTVVQDVLKDKVPSGFVLRKEQFETDFDLEEEGRVYKFEVSVRANLLPQVDVSELARKIRGKYPELANEFLPKEVPGFVRAEIKIKPTLPGRLGTLPRIAKNIEIEVAAER